MTMSNDVNSPDKWNLNYEKGDDGWDLNGPTPVFRRLAESQRFEPGRMIVFGAGRGHDAREFARHKFTVTAVDFASIAINEMMRLARPDASVTILQQDLFTFPHEYDGMFDYVLEYTCFCAIDPKRRGEYADVITRVLKPGGTLIDLAYPLDGRPGGPPFSYTDRELMGLFEDRGFDLVSREIPEDTITRRRGAEELFVLKKAA